MIAVNAFKDPKKVPLHSWLAPMKRKRTGSTKKVHWLALTGDEDITEVKVIATHTDDEGDDDEEEEDQVMGNE